jgi:hypothetical protein
MSLVLNRQIANLPALIPQPYGSLRSHRPLPHLGTKIISIRKPSLRKGLTLDCVTSIFDSTWASSAIVTDDEVDTVELRDAFDPSRHLRLTALLLISVSSVGRGVGF